MAGNFLSIANERIGNALARRPNSSVIRRVAPPVMRNVTPPVGGGVSSVAQGSRFVNPITALLASTVSANVGSETRRDPMLTANIRELIASENRAKENRQYLRDSDDAYYESIKNNSGKPVKLRPFTGPTEELIAQGLGPESTKPVKLRPFTGPTEELIAQGLGPEDITAGAPKATIVPEQADLSEKAVALFRRTHGGPFDPKSAKDRNKLAAITSLLNQEGSDKLTPNQFALRIYRKTK